MKVKRVYNIIRHDVTTGNYTPFGSAFTNKAKAIKECKRLKEEFDGFEFSIDFLELLEDENNTWFTYRGTIYYTAD